MPFYDMQCKQCGHEDEEQFPSSEINNLQTCPACSEQQYERVWKSMPGLMLRGAYADISDTARKRKMDPLKKIAQLEVQKADLPPKERGDIQKEINTLKKVKT